MDDTNERYESPTLEVLGTVTELTATGCTNLDGDMKGGSVMSNGKSAGGTDKDHCDSD